MKKGALIILDGWGIGPLPERSAIAKGNTPFMDELMQSYPNSTLVTYGEDVGLPEGQMGNSEVGHLNIGAGRVVYQELARINNSIKSGELAENEILIQALVQAKENNQRVHLMGLLSDGGVHSHINHLLALIDICDSHKLSDLFVHCILDGRDTSPTSGKIFLQTLLKKLGSNSHLLSSIIGRYYAMDRDKRWERTKKAYDLLVSGVGEKISDNLLEYIQSQYDQGITDEFMLPIIINEDANIRSGDLVIFYNFRTDRPRQITEALTQRSIPEYNMNPISIDFITMTEYDQTFQGISVLFRKDNLTNTLGEVIASHGLTQVRLAETEKYPHVTYFLSGGREEPFIGEERIVIPSPKVATYDLQPEMSAPEVTQAILDKINEDQPDFICLNYANTDMVGHTGVFDAAVRAAETVDKCMSQLIPVLQEHDYEIIIIADHGNSDYMINDDGTPHTAHTTNPVPCILVSSENHRLIDGRLADIAPTLCHLMGLKIPPEMDGNNLTEKN